MSGPAVRGGQAPGEQGPFRPPPAIGKVADLEDLKAGPSRDTGSPSARHHCGQSPGRGRRAPAVNASQASRPPGATAVTAVAKTARSQ